MRQRPISTPMPHIRSTPCVSPGRRRRRWVLAGIPLLLAALLAGCSFNAAPPSPSIPQATPTLPPVVVPPSPPSPSKTPSGPKVEAPNYPLATDGNRIVDAKGKTVVWRGVNWFGLETTLMVPHGLLVRDYRDMLQQIAGLGFNTVRIPFSLAAVEASTPPYLGISFEGGSNAELEGKTPLEIMDAVIEEADRLGLMVILDNHSQSPGGYTYDLWFGQDGYTEADWVATWEMLARRYVDNLNVVAFDLKNEPHGRATWGDGGVTDWKRAAELAGNAILAVAPQKLIVVSGIEGPVEGGQIVDKHWWGGNLEGVRNHPVRLSKANRVVYTVHEYGPEVYPQPWFNDPNMTEILAHRWANGFGFIHEEGIAPVLVGEFGAISFDPGTVPGKWMHQFVEYLAATGINWTYWSWNPNSGDTGGVLTDDWRNVHPDKMELLVWLMTNAERPVARSSR